MPNKLREWPEQHASNALYALGLLRYEASPEFWTTIASEMGAPGRIAGLSTIGLDSVLYGLSLLRVRAPQLIIALCEQLLERGEQ